MPEAPKRQRWNHLESLRYQRGLNQRALAERVGISTAYMSELESGARRVTPDLLVRFATALDADVERLEQTRPKVIYPTPPLDRDRDRRINRRRINHRTPPKSDGDDTERVA